MTAPKSTAAAPADAERLLPSPELNVHQRLLGLMQDVGGQIEKRQAHQGQGFFIDDVEAAVRPALIRWRLTAFTTKIDYELRADANSQGRIQYAHDTRTETTITNVDKPDDRVVIPSFAIGLDQSDKGPGKALSYASKYVWLSSLHLRGQEEAEADAPTRAQTRPAAAQGAPQPTNSGGGDRDYGPITIPAGRLKGTPFDDPSVPLKELRYWAENAKKPEYADAAFAVLAARGADADDAPPDDNRWPLDDEAPY